MKVAAVLPFILAVFIGTAASQAPYRTWRDQKGRTLQASFVRLDGSNAVIQLENGAMTSVPLALLSLPDQAYARAAAADGATAGMTPALPVAKQPLQPKALAWPVSVAVNPKDLQITVGEQNPQARSFTYQSGSFQFVSNAALSGTVMKDIAADFELTRALYQQLPWGWEPRPRNGNRYFLAKLFETQEDFIAGGGTDNSSGGSTDDYVFQKFSSLGLKKVGDRYAFDPKLRKDGAMISLINRLMMGDMRGLCLPWGTMGLETLLEQVCYRNSTFTFTNLDRPLKVAVEGFTSRQDCPLDLNRAIAFLRLPWKDRRDDVVSLRTQNYLDGMLLVYYFGFLDDDGKGARLHHYFYSVARDSTEYRNYRDSGRTTRMSWGGSFDDHAQELNQIIIGGRTDDQLAEQMRAKFKAIGLKL